MPLSELSKDNRYRVSNERRSPIDGNEYTRRRAKASRFRIRQAPIFGISFSETCSSTLWEESEAEGFKGYHMIQSGFLDHDFDELIRMGKFSRRLGRSG
jgi:hypothetical protein